MKIANGLLLTFLFSTAGAVEWRGPVPVIVFNPGDASSSPDAVTVESIKKLQATGMSDDVLSGIVEKAKAVSVDAAFIGELEKDGKNPKLVASLKPRIKIEYEILSEDKAQKAMIINKASPLGDSGHNGSCSPIPFEKMNGKSVVYCVVQSSYYNDLRIMAKPADLNGLPVIFSGSLEKPSKYITVETSSRLSCEDDKLKVDQERIKCIGTLIDGKGGKNFIFTKITHEISHKDFYTVSSASEFKEIKVLEIFTGQESRENKNSVLIGLNPGRLMLINKESNKTTKDDEVFITPCQYQDGVISPIKERTQILPPDGFDKEEIEKMRMEKTGDIVVSDVDVDGNFDIIIKMKSNKGKTALYFVYNQDAKLILVVGQKDLTSYPYSAGSGLFIGNGKSGKGSSIFSILRK